MCRIEALWKLDGRVHLNITAHSSRAVEHLALVDLAACSSFVIGCQHGGAYCAIHVVPHDVHYGGEPQCLIPLGLG